MIDNESLIFPYCKDCIEQFENDYDPTKCDLSKKPNVGMKYFEVLRCKEECRYFGEQQYAYKLGVT